MFLFIPRMAFSSNIKTIEYINTILTNKATNALILNEEFLSKMNNLYHKVLNLNKEADYYKYYAINNECFKFDRNVIVQLKILSITVSSLYDSADSPTDEMKQMYTGLILLAEDIEKKYCKLCDMDENQLFIITSSQLFPIFLKPVTGQNKMAKNIHEFVKDHIEYLEYMTYVIINYIDNKEYDIKSYSNDFMREFQEMEF
jgi:hypothetical protein